MADDVSAEARKIYERVVVFDANAYPPSGDTIPVPPDLLEMSRLSGVTALKWTLGGVDAELEATLAEIACVQRMIEAYPDVFMQVRMASDFDRARRERRLGIVLSFESVEDAGRQDRTHRTVPEPGRPHHATQLQQGVAVRRRRARRSGSRPDRSRPRSRLHDEPGRRGHRHQSREPAVLARRDRGLRPPGTHHARRVCRDPRSSAEQAR